jgi:AcrR family transcriptional regulator
MATKRSAGVTARRPSGHSGRRNRDAAINAAAIEVFSRKGYAAASMQDVADAVGLLKGSLYHYISSKEELLFRLFDLSHKQGMEIIEEVLALDLSPLARLDAFFERYVRWYLENVERVGVCFNEWRYLEGEQRKVLVDSGRLYTRFVRSQIEEAKDAGEIREDLDARLASLYVMGAINAVPDWYRRKGPESPDRIARHYADMSMQLVTGTPPKRQSAG